MPVSRGTAHLQVHCPFPGGLSHLQVHCFQGDCPLAQVTDWLATWLNRQRQGNSGAQPSAKGHPATREGWCVPAGVEPSPGLLLPTAAWEACPCREEGFAGGVDPPLQKRRPAVLPCAGLTYQFLMCSHYRPARDRPHYTSSTSSQMKKVGLMGKQLPKVIIVGKGS